MPLGLALLSACATPKHTNTLIFGTNTKIAIDVSQDPVGTVGLTIGYRRQEAVWMPLLANQGAGYQPSSCSSEACVSFAGSTGTGGAAGAGARDTYSVLATLSGQTSGQAGGGNTSVKAGGAIAQVFATGFAARFLAVTGGAALVNTNSDPTTAATASALNGEATILNKVRTKQISVLLTCVAGSADQVDAAKLTGLVDKASALDPQKRLFNDADVVKLKGFGGGPLSRLDEYLDDLGMRFVKPLEAQIKVVCP